MKVIDLENTTREECEVAITALLVNCNRFKEFLTKYPNHRELFRHTDGWPKVKPLYPVAYLCTKEVHPNCIDLCPLWRSAKDVCELLTYGD